MSEQSTHPKWALAREAATFQFKLVLDGLRDAALIPVSFFAALAGLFSSGRRPDRHYRKVIDWGRQSERWIDLFGSHEPLDSGVGGSLDSLIDTVERVVTEEYRKGNTTAAARDAVEKALQRLESRGAPDQKGSE